MTSITEHISEPEGAHKTGYVGINTDEETGVCVAVDPRYLVDAAQLAYERLDKTCVYLRVQPDYPVLLTRKPDSRLGVALAPWVRGPVTKGE